MAPQETSFPTFSLNFSYVGSIFPRGRGSPEAGFHLAAANLTARFSRSLRDTTSGDLRQTEAEKEILNFG